MAKMTPWFMGELRDGMTEGPRREFEAKVWIKGEVRGGLSDDQRREIEEQGWIDPATINYSPGANCYISPRCEWCGRKVDETHERRYIAAEVQRQRGGGVCSECYAAAQQ